jgi:hypothetical protein
MLRGVERGIRCGFMDLDQSKKIAEAVNESQDSRTMHRSHLEIRRRQDLTRKKKL